MKNKTSSISLTDNRIR